MANNKMNMGALVSSLSLLAMATFAGVQPTESEVVQSFASARALPELKQMADRAQQLQDRVADFCAAPSEHSLENAQTAWKESYLTWRRAEPFLFGPASKMNRFIGKWPINPIVLDAAVEADDLSYMLDDADTRGFAAAEHLLFAPASAAAASTEGRRKHLKSVTEEIARRCIEAEQLGRDEFFPEFKAAGDGKPYLLPSDALSMAFRELMNVTERMLRNRIGGPSGYFRNATKPEDLEAWTSVTTQAGFTATIEGIRHALGTLDEASITALLATKDGLVEVKNPKLAADLFKQMNRIEKTIDGLGKDVHLDVALKKKNTLLKRLYDQTETLQEQLIEASLVLELDAHQGLLVMPTDAAAQ